MNQITLTSNNYSNYTMIQNRFIDEYMPSASGSYVKIYLYLIRCLNDPYTNLSIGSIADHLDNTENDIIRALSYWEKVGLLTITRDADQCITSIQINHMASESKSERISAVASETASTMETVATVSKPTEEVPVEDEYIKPVYTESQINEITSDEEVKWMLHIIELYLERPLQQTDVQLILYLYESLNFSRELIMYLYEYCISKHKKHASYIEKVALNWAKEGIDTVEKAEQSTAVFNTQYNAVVKAFGLNRSIAEVEQQYVNKWFSNYKFSNDMIVEACNRTIIKTGKPDFRYADSILTNWKKKGVLTLNDVKRSDEVHKNSTKNTSYTKPSTSQQTTSTNKFNAFPQREYSKEYYADLEKKMMTMDYIGENRQKER